MARSVRIFWKIFFMDLALLYCCSSLSTLVYLGRCLRWLNWKTHLLCWHTEVYGDDGTPMGKYYKERGNRSNVNYKDISKYVIDALIATEDERFYDHSGIDGKEFGKGRCKIWDAMAARVPSANSWQKICSTRDLKISLDALLKN